MAVKSLDEEALFHAARRIASAEDRDQFLRHAGGNDKGLVARVRALLEMHDREPSRQDEPELRTSAYEPVDERAGSQVGPYMLREQIGEGGFGLVFVAEQTQPVRRKVALKVIKPGMDTRAVVARFEAERQALALMDHPNIAKVLDAGATDGGRPYFVMELVKGMPITDYADANNLSPRERLGLFVLVCQAVQHAHHKGIIHRDIKPGNVLVTVIDGVAIPKVIDFGVAKAVGQQLTDKTLYTRFAAMVGTPLYMSPEQAELSGVDVDTRADIYALGVLLYELLTGTTPFDRQRFAKAAFDEIRRIIKEEEPPRPSTRLTSLGETLSSTAARRGTEPGKLAGVVRGELDWIVMRCLEKDRSRRYETATGLAKDVQRYLSGDAVEACPPTLGYRLRKAYRRNRAAVLTGGAFAVMMLLATGVSLAFGIRAKQEERRAETAARDAEASKNVALMAAQDAERNKSTALKAATDRELAIEYLSGVLAEFNPFRHPTGKPSIQEILDAACNSLDQPDMPGGRKARLTPIVRAKVRMVFGRMYMDVHEYKKGQAQLKKAYDELEGLNGPKDLDTLKAMETYANSLGESRISQKDLEDAENLLTKAHKIRADVQGSGHPDTLKTLRMQASAVFYQREDPFARVAKLHQEALREALANPDLGENHLITAGIQFDLADVIKRSGKKENLDEARQLCKRAMETYKLRLGPDHPSTVRAEFLRASIRDETTNLTDIPKRLDELIPRLIDACKTEVDFRVLHAYHACALYSLLTGNVKIAGKCTQKVLELTPKLLGERHPNMRLAYCDLGWYYVLAGQADKAEKCLHEVFSNKYSDGRTESEGGWDVNALRNAYTLRAQCLLQRPMLKEEQFREAEDDLKKAEELEEKAPKHLGSSGWSRERHNTLRWEQRVRLYTLWGKPDEAAIWKKKIAELTKKK